MAKWFEIKAAAEGNGQQTAVVYLYDDIGYWGVTAKDFAEALKGLGPVTALTVRINSGGGEVFAGIAIHNLLRSHPATVTVKIDGFAGSIASVIAMAGDVVEMPDNAMMMIHNPSWGAWGESDDLRETADILDQIKKSLVTSYCAKTGLPEERISELMSASTWMTAAEAKELGFADAVTTAVDATNFSRVDPAKFGPVPTAFSGRFGKASVTPPTDPAPNNSTTKPEGGTMTAPNEGTPPTNAVSPQQVATQCQAAGLPELTAKLLSGPVTADALTAALADAKAIVECGEQVKRPAQARRLVQAGVSLADARAILLDGAAEADASVVTNTTPPTSGQGAAKPVIDYASIYARQAGRTQG